MRHDKRTITAMVTGMVIGAALVSEAAAGIVAEPTWQKIYVDGQQVSMTAYNIAGNNFVRLRDIGQQVGFNVYWSDGVQIDTDAPYTGVAPVQEVNSQPTDIIMGVSISTSSRFNYYLPGKNKKIIAIY